MKDVNDTKDMEERRAAGWPLKPGDSADLRARRTELSPAIPRAPTPGAPAQRLPGGLDQHVVTARNEMSPLLTALINQLSNEGRDTHAAHFARIRQQLDEAAWDQELCNPLVALAMSTTLGFALSPTSEALQEQILKKAHTLHSTLTPFSRPAH
ncbi:MAG: hypothetical protein AAF513_09270 [Pseudomonadota bacterium]